MLKFTEFSFSSQQQFTQTWRFHTWYSNDNLQKDHRRENQCFMQTDLFGNSVSFLRISNIIFCRWRCPHSPMENSNTYKKNMKGFKECSLKSNKKMMLNGTLHVSQVAGSTSVLPWLQPQVLPSKLMAASQCPLSWLVFYQQFLPACWFIPSLGDFGAWQSQPPHHTHISQHAGWLSYWCSLGLAAKCELLQESPVNHRWNSYEEIPSETRCEVHRLLHAASKSRAQNATSLCEARDANTNL